MAHYARIDKNNIVQEIIVVDNAIAVSEQDGIDYIANELKLDGTWIQTSYNGNIRGKFAGAGDIYDPKTDTFAFNKARQDEIDKVIEEQIKKDKIEEQKKEALVSKLGLSLEELRDILK